MGGGGGGSGLPPPIRYEFIQCNCEGLAVRPFPPRRILGVQPRCGFYCECSDGFIGVALFTTAQLEPMCGPLVNHACPVSITTEDVVLVIEGVTVGRSPIVTGCRM